MTEQANVKKAYVDIVNFLTENGDKKVKTILNDVIAMCAPKAGGGGGAAATFHRDEEGNVVAVRCYYHGLWMDPSIVEFGVKANSASGLNSMSKDGMSKWTKQQRVAKNAKDQLLADVAAGEVSAEDLPTALADIEAARQEVLPLEGNYTGFETLEECLEFSANNPGFEFQGVDTDEEAA